MAATWASETASLNSLLECERACVAVVVALASGATERAEREEYASLGGHLIVCCGALRERLELAGVPSTRTTAPDAAAILGTDTYDARLLAFAELLERTAEQATETLGAATEGATQRTLRDLIETHSHAAEWSRTRAVEFAATRLLYLPADPLPAAAASDQPAGAATSNTQAAGSGNQPERPTEGSESP